MDVLSNVLTLTNLAPHVLGAHEFVAPWGVSIAQTSYSALHVVRRGSCWLHCAGIEPVQLDAGDIVLLAHGTAHSLSSSYATHDLEPYEEAIGRAERHVIQPRHDKIDTQVEPTLLHRAGYGFSQEGPHPLLALLPQLVRIPAEQVAQDGELTSLLRLVGQEAARADEGVALVLPRLLDTLFVYVLRTWLRMEPQRACGWLGALRDPQIRKALSLIHERPQQAWTVAMLAHSVAMSRAVFAKRFAELVGETPLAYVTRWRMDVAAKLLRESREPVARIAGRVGYVSETAFAKAFRRRRNVAPGAYRYRIRRASVVPTG